jgi:phosphoadenosine phosphosulfate reductase
LVGIRAEESYTRRKREQIELVPSVKSFVFKPIFHWVEWHVWEFIEKWSLPYPSLYDKGFSRIGCIVCPFICGDMKKIEMHRQIAPGIYKAFERAVTWWFYNKRPLMTKSRKYKDADEYLQDWYMGFPKRGNSPKDERSLPFIS